MQQRHRLQYRRPFLAAFAVATLVGLAACDGSQPPAGGAGASTPSADSSAGPAPQVPAMPKGQLGGAVTPDHYRLDLEIVPERERFSGEVGIDITIHEPAPVIWLHGNRLEVTEASLTSADGDTIAADYEQVAETGVARLELERVPPSGAATLHFTYSAPFDTSLEGLYKVVEDEQAYAFTQFEATSARLAFPGFDEPVFKTPFDIEVTAPAGETVVTATPEVSSEAVGEGLVRHEFATTKPLPTYLIAFAVGPLDVVEAEPLPPTGVRAREIALRGVAAAGKGDQLEYALAHTAGILEALERYFGRPYPYRKLDIIAVPDFAAGAMENVGAITYREPLLLLGDGEGVSTSRKRRYARVHAHELAHQWFGNLVTPKWWDDIWLNEAFATWMGNKAVDAWRPDEGYGNLTLKGALGVMDNDAMVSARQIREPVHSNHDIANAFDGITYRKGGGVLDMFESWLGEQAFRAGVRLHLQRFEHGAADVDDFLQSLADGAERPEVVDAFSSFLFQPGVPLVSANLQCGADGPSLELQQQRYLPLGSAGERERTWQIPVCAAFGDGADGRDRLCHLLQQPAATVALPGDNCPAWLMPNADGSGYYRFALDDAGWSGLFERFDAINDREALALMGSLSAAYRSGDADTATLAEAFRIFAPSGQREVATKPIEDLRHIHDYLATTAAAKRGVEAFVRTLYRDRLETLGWQARPGEDAETRLLRADVIEALADPGRAEAVRAELVRRVEAYLSTQGLNADAIDPGLIGMALQVAVEHKGMAFARTLRERMLASRDATFRGRALRALAHAPQPAIGEMARALITDQRLRDNEAIAIVYTQAGTPSQRDAIWDWVQANLDALLNRIPSWRQGAVIAVAGGFCTESRARAVQAFFADKVESLEGGPRELAQTTERIRLCATLREAKAKEVQTWFGTRRWREAAAD